jgi:hypothetical protein
MHTLELIGFNCGAKKTYSGIAEAHSGVVELTLEEQRRLTMELQRLTVK